MGRDPSTADEAHEYWAERLAQRVSQLEEQLEEQQGGNASDGLRGRLAEARRWLVVVEAQREGRLSTVADQALSLLAAPDTDPAPLADRYTSVSGEALRDLLGLKARYDDREPPHRGGH